MTTRPYRDQNVKFCKRCELPFFQGHKCPDGEYGEEDPYSGESVGFTVEHGETLYMIAGGDGRIVDLLLDLNRMDPNNIPTGFILQVPRGLVSKLHQIRHIRKVQGAQRRYM